MQDLPKGGQFFFEFGRVACREASCHALAREVRGYASLGKFFKWCKLMRFGAYFDTILT